MTKGPENTFRDSKLRKLLDNLPCYYFVKEAKSLRGLPDIIGVTKGGRFFALEIKKDKAELSCSRSTLQGYILDKMRRMGGFAEFVYPENLEQTIKTLIFSSFSKDEAVSVWTRLTDNFPELLPQKE